MCLEGKGVADQTLSGAVGAATEAEGVEGSGQGYMYAGGVCAREWWRMLGPVGMVSDNLSHELQLHRRAAAAA
jgi:hypothetical protein